MRPFALSLFTPAPAEPAPCAAALLYWLVGPGSAGHWPALPGVRGRGRGGFVGVPPQGKVSGPGVHWRVPLAPGRYLTDPAVLHAALTAVAPDHGDYEDRPYGRTGRGRDPGRHHYEGERRKRQAALVEEHPHEDDLQAVDFKDPYEVFHRSMVPGPRAPTHPWESNDEPS